MKFFSFLTIFAAAIAASPIATDSTQSETAITNEFYLRTTNSHQPEHNQLYVVAYPTSAGLNDAVLTKDNTTANSVYLNGTRAFVNLGTSSPWGLVLSGEAEYTTTNNASWDPVMINSGEGQTGFGINDQNLFHWSYPKGFNGWVVCQWYHNVPQLFWKSGFYYAYLPCSCSWVELKVFYKS